MREITQRSNTVQNKFVNGGINRRDASEILGTLSIVHKMRFIS